MDFHLTVFISEFQYLTFDYNFRMIFKKKNTFKQKH